ncbi:cathepsin W-like isoform X2 [Rana temporaria]|uniref:cathepsin W-like isoform X2 n=1 Tax=Rana temporaria TaxID=8407 RepID=UPI001AADD524|nr:cathepsin W-like isoform X2 [Rana temporaria]
MLLLCAISAVLVLFPDPSCTSSEMVQFANFIQQFNKSYSRPEEFLYRLSVFSKNMEVAARLQRDEMGTAEYGVTKFSDLTAEEFRSYGIKSSIGMDLSNLKRATTSATFPSSRDWRKMGVISEVKNQGQCGSCWAFAAVGNIEAQWGIQGAPRNLSVQQVIDCGPCDDGCRGGYTWDAYITVLNEGGLVSEEEYPYSAVRKNCRKDLTAIGWIYDFQMLAKDETEMTSYVGNHGTLTVIINGVLLQHYKNGIVDNLPQNCNPDYNDHAVLIVGYVNKKHIPYWIVKNSYGPNWGEKGYFRIFLGKNMCGITKYPISAIVTKKKSTP